MFKICDFNQLVDLRKSDKEKYVLILEVYKAMFGLIEDSDGYQSCVEMVFGAKPIMQYKGEPVKWEDFIRFCVQKKDGYLRVDIKVNVIIEKMRDIAEENDCLVEILDKRDKNGTIGCTFKKRGC